MHVDPENVFSSQAQLCLNYSDNQTIRDKRSNAAKHQEARLTLKQEMSGDN